MTGSAQLCLDFLATSDVRPGADKLRRSARLVFDDPEGILNPNVVPVAMAEAILDRSPAVLDQGWHFLEDSRCVLGMETVGPRLRISGHLLWRIAHDGAEIFTDESAGKIA